MKTLADKVISFNSKFSGPTIPPVSEIELNELRGLPIEDLSRDILLSFTLNISCLVLSGGRIGPISTEVSDRLITKSYVSKDEIIEWLIERLKPLLLHTPDHRRNTDRVGLKPKVGFSLKEDEARREWKERGGIKSIPLFYTVLSHLEHRNVSSNLWWITPGILNLLDDTSDLVGIKLRGVQLLKTFLDHGFSDESHWLPFNDTGLFGLYEPILLNMCYYLPPAYSSDESLKVWKEVFPTLNALYKRQFGSRVILYRKYLGKFLSEFILQQALPRINLTNETLAIYLLDTVVHLIRILEASTLYYLTRIIYTLGEYLVKNPFFTAFEELVRKTLETVETLVSVLPSGRLNAHKFDLLALVLIPFDKCKQEGKLTADLTTVFKRILHSMEAKGCHFDSEKEELLKIKDVGELFS